MTQIDCTHVEYVRGEPRKPRLTCDLKEGHHSDHSGKAKLPVKIRAGLHENQEARHYWSDDAGKYSSADGLRAYEGDAPLSAATIEEREDALLIREAELSTELDQKDEAAKGMLERIAELENEARDRETEDAEKEKEDKKK